MTSSPCDLIFLSSQGRTRHATTASLMGESSQPGRTRRSLLPQTPPSPDLCSCGLRLRGSEALRFLETRDYFPLRLLSIPTSFFPPQCPNLSLSR